MAESSGGERENSSRQIGRRVESAKALPDAAHLRDEEDKPLSLASMKPHERVPSPEGQGEGAPRVKTLHSDEDMSLIEWGCFVIACWHAETTINKVRRLRSQLPRLGALHPTGIGVMQLVPPAARPPGSAARSELGAMLRESGDWVRCSSVVVIGEGFRMAGARAFVATVAQLARPSFPHRVFSSVEQAASWHRQMLPDSAHFSEQALVREANRLLLAPGSGTHTSRRP